MATTKTARKSTRKTAAKRVSPNKGVIRSERVIEAGPRGFRFGETWNTAVKSQSGIAIHPTYFLKLKAQAKELGVSAAGKQEDVCARVAAALKKTRGSTAKAA
jgi:hypothetical protein